MNAERLLALYEKVAEAPDAIARLRRFVLDLAVRGKLVPQESGGEPAQLKQGPESADLPFELPNNWRWIRIGDQLDLLNGIAFKPTDWVSSGVRIVRIQNLNNPDAPFNYCRPEMARDRSLIDDGSFLISWSGTPGTSFGAFIWARGPAVLNQHIFRCDFRTSFFDPRFLKLAVNGRLDEMIAKAHGGVGLQHITKGKLEAMLIPLPPITEQRRIVTKVEELMALLDQLEAARTAREATRDRLTAASLTRLTAPGTTPEMFHTHARFALDALPALTSRTDQIKSLRQTILNLAVRGKLVEQDPAERVAERFFGQADFDWLPPTWRTLNFGEHCDIEGGNQPPKSQFVDEPRPGYVRLLQIRDLGEKPVPVYIPEASTNRFCGEGEILIGRYGASVGKIFWAQGGAYNVALTKFVWPDGALTAKFAFILLKSDLFQGKLAGASRSAQAGFNKSDLRDIDFPLPPLAEQHRIVVKVDELMALCNRLEAALTSADTTKQRLLEALLREALEPTLKEAA